MPSTNARKSRVVGKLFVDCEERSHIIYEREGCHCTVICGKYICGLPDRDRSELPKCRQCLNGNLQTKIPVWMKANKFSAIELKLVKTKTGRRVFKRRSYK